MSDDLKIQIPISVPADTSGFKEMGTAAQAMAQTVQQAGQQAATGLDKIGEGAKRAADSLNRDAGRITSEIKRITLEMQSLGKTASEKIDLKIAAKGLDAAQFAPLLAQLKEVESARAAIGAQQSKDAFVGDLRGQITSLREATKLQSLTADEALRYKAAQAGASVEAAHLITQLTNMRAAQEAAAEAAQRQALAQKEAAAAAKTRDTFVGGLETQVTSLREQQQFAKMTADEVLRYKAGLVGASAAAEPLIAELSKLRGEQEAAANAALRLAEAQKEAAAAARTRDSFIGGLKSETDSIGKTRADLLELKAAQLGVSKEASGYIAKLRAIEAGQASMGVSAKQAAFALRQVPAQFTDIVVSLQAGQSPMQVLLQQGGQLKDLFGGVGNAARAIGGYVLGLINPFTVAAAAAVGLGVAMASAESRARELNNVQAQLGATGRGDLFSTTELKAFIAELALAPGVTRSTATAMVGELTKIKGISGDLFRELPRLAVDFAKATGTDIPTALRTLGQAFADPLKGIKELDQQLNGQFKSGQINAIELETKRGELAKSQKILFDALRGAIKGTADEAMTPLQKSVNDLGNAWEKAMGQLDKSEGLRTLNALLAKTVEAVAFLVENSGKLGGLGNAAMFQVPGLAPAALGTAAGEALSQGARSLFGSQTPPTTRREVVGKVTDASGAPLNAGPAAVAAPAGASDKDKDEFIKKAHEAGLAYRGEAQQLADLTLERDRQNKALRYAIDLYGKNSEQAKSARAAVQGVNEALQKVGGAERQQVIDARLDQKLKAAKEALEAERATLAFQERFLQGEYAAGEKSLRDFYEQKRQAIAQGVQIQVTELEKERVAVAEHLKATKATNPKDKSTIVKDETRLKDIDAEEAKLRVQASREVILSTQEETVTTRALREEVTNYRAALLLMIGDEAGAAKLRDELAIEQAQRLAVRAKAQGFSVDQSEIARNAEALRSIRLVNEATRQSSIVKQALALDEERIAMAERAGAVGSFEALAQVGEARKRVIAQLEEQVQLQEKVAAQLGNENNWELKLNAAQARQQLEQLKEQMDPLAEHFRSLFTDVTGNLIADLANDPKNAKQAFTKFFSGITSQINGEIGKSLSTQLLGKDGPLGSLPGAFGTLFGKGAKPLDKPLVDTTGITGSLRTLETAGIDPTVAAFARLQAAIDAGTGGFSRLDRGQAPATLPTTGDLARLDRGQEPVSPPTTGDFARLDRGQTNDTGERQVFDLFASAKRGSDTFASSTADAAGTVMQLAGAAARGNDALSLLPYIVRLIQSAASSGGGGSTSGLAGLFGAGASSSTAVNLGTASGADLALFFHSGGVVGQTSDARPVPRDVFADAGRYHGGGLVGPEQKMREAGALKPNEVPAILMGGPKGTREEVLTADDPRHSDNLNPKLKHLIDRMPRYHEGGVVGEKSYLVPSAPMAAPAPANREEGWSGGSGGSTQVINVHVTATPQTTRETAMQTGTNVARGLARAQRNR